MFNLGVNESFSKVRLFLHQSLLKSINFELQQNYISRCEMILGEISGFKRNEHPRRKCTVRLNGIEKLEGISLTAITSCFIGRYLVVLSTLRKSNMSWLLENKLNMLIIFFLFQYFIS